MSKIYKLYPSYARHRDRDGWSGVVRYHGGIVWRCPHVHPNSGNDFPALWTKTISECALKCARFVLTPCTTKSQWWPDHRRDEVYMLEHREWAMQQREMFVRYIVLAKLAGTLVDYW